jgi:urease accessory protein
MPSETFKICENKHCANNNFVSTGTDSAQWRARFSAHFYLAENQTRMGLTQHHGPLRVQRPYHPEPKDCLHFYLLHPPGGLVGGDRVSVNLDLGADTKVLMTTPSAGKIYRNITPHYQVQESQLTLGHGAVLEYLPQENIIFNGAKAELATCVDLASEAIFIGWEIVCLGLHESHQVFNNGELKQLIKISRNGKPLFIERLALSGESDLLLSAAGLQACSVFGTLVITADIMHDEQISEQLICWQKSLDSTQVRIAITQKPGICIVRALGNKSEKLRESFQVFWQTVRPFILNREAFFPRIWST